MLETDTQENRKSEAVTGPRSEWSARGKKSLPL